MATILSRGKISFLTVPTFVIAGIFLAPLFALLTAWLYHRIGEFAFIFTVSSFPFLTAWFCINVGKVYNRAVAIFEAIVICSIFSFFYFIFIHFLPSREPNFDLVSITAHFILNSFDYILSVASIALDTQAVFLLVFLLLLMLILFVDRVDSFYDVKDDDNGLNGKYTMFFDTVNNIRLLEGLQEDSYKYISNLGKFSREPKTTKHSEITVNITGEKCRISIYNKRPCMAKSSSSDYFYDPVMLDLEISRQLGKRLIMR